MRVLTVTYNGVELFTGPVEEVQFTHSGAQVSVTGKFTKPASGDRGLAGLADMLVSASKQKTAERVKELEDTK